MSGVGLLCRNKQVLPHGLLATPTQRLPSTPVAIAVGSCEAFDTPGASSKSPTMEKTGVRTAGVTCAGSTFFAVAPIVLGRGERIWDDLRGLEAEYEVTSEVAESGTTHLSFRR